MYLCTRYTLVHWERKTIINFIKTGYFIGIVVKWKKNGVFSEFADPSFFLFGHFGGKELYDMEIINIRLRNWLHLILVGFLFSPFFPFFACLLLLLLLLLLSVLIPQHFFYNARHWHLLWSICLQLKCKRCVLLT